MELLKITVSDVSAEIKRLTGYVRYDDGLQDEYWFEYPSEFEVSESGNLWLALLLPLAATINEDLHIPLPLDPRIVDGAADILRIWHSWNSGTSIIKVFADGGLHIIDQRPSLSAAFFSTGLDAFYTSYERPRAKHKILIHGFDLAIDKTNEFKAHLARISKVTELMNNTIIPVATNVRTTRWSKTRWQRVSHGSFLSAIGLLFEKHFREVFIGSSHSNYNNLVPNGSHPLTDVLYSTSRTSLIHSGDGLDRLDKTKYLAQHELALRHLHVCIRGRDGKGQDELNCSHCEKCYRTMIGLDVVGVLDKCDLFDKSRYNYNEVKNIFLNAPDSIGDYLNMAKLAKSQGKTELSAGIHKCIRRSRLLRFLNCLNKTPILWRIPHAMEKNSIY
tara:strand:+ start:80600 stop:81766 length:1167 start_codon:yes stop_codon:yes gene_type:complete